MKTIEIVLSEERKASMTMYLNLESPEFGFTKRPLMVVLPGGGYTMCSDRESEVVALKYLAEGYQACILRYTLRDKAPWPQPLLDYEETMEHIAAHAEQWHIDMDHTAVVGFSAGGHLAASIVTMAVHRPKAAVLVYPAILREICNVCQPNLPLPYEHVDANTSPCFIVAARDDAMVPVSNALQMALALEKAGVSFETYIYASGQHGFSTATPAIRTSEACARLPRWVEDSIQWLGEIMGRLTNHGFEEPELLPHVTGDMEEFLSVRCTLRHLRTQHQADGVMAPIYRGVELVAQARGFNPEGLYIAVGEYQIKDLAETLGVGKEQIQNMDAALKQIPNAI